MAYFDESDPNKYFIPKRRKRQYHVFLTWKSGKITKSNFVYPSKYDAHKAINWIKRNFTDVIAYDISER